MSPRSNLQSDITSNSNINSDNSDDDTRSDTSLVQQSVSQAECTLSNKTTSILDSTTEVTASVSSSSNVNTVYLHKSLQSSYVPLKQLIWSNVLSRIPPNLSQGHKNQKAQ